MTDNKYSEDITSDFDIQVTNGGTTVNDKDSKHSGKDYVIKISDAKLKDSIKVEDIHNEFKTTADDGSITFKGVNTATNEDSNSNDVDDKIVKSKADIKPETKIEKKMKLNQQKTNQSLSLKWQLWLKRERTIQI